MRNQQDNGYISDLLIHWTGENGDEKGSEILTEIISTCRLLLSHNSLHVFDSCNEIHGKMVCFTDVPLTHSEQHCQQEGFPPCTGRLEIEGDKPYFGFDKEHIAFIIAPQNHLKKFQNVDGFQAVAYEDLVHKKLDTQYAS